MADNSSQEQASIQERMAGLLAAEDKPPEESPDTTDDAAVEDEDEDQQQDDDQQTDEGDQQQDDDSQTDEDEQPDPDDLSQALWEVPGEGQLTTEEMLAGRLRHSDYTKKTQRLAEERREFESTQLDVQDKGKKYDEYLERMEVAIDSLLPKEEDLSDLRKSNPAEYAAKKADIQDAKDKLTAIQAERQRRSDETAQELQAALDQEIEKERGLTLEAFPQWKDAEVQKADLTGMVAAAKYVGYTEQDLDNVTDHRLVKLLHMAAQQHKQESLKPLVRKRTKGAQVVSRPGAKKRKPSNKGQNQRLRDDLKKTGSKEAAANLFLDMLAEGKI